MITMHRTYSAPDEYRTQQAHVVGYVLLFARKLSIALDPEFAAQITRLPHRVIAALAELDANNILDRVTRGVDQGGGHWHLPPFTEAEVDGMVADLTSPGTPTQNPLPVDEAIDRIIKESGVFK